MASMWMMACLAMTMMCGSCPTSTRQRQASPMPAKASNHGRTAISMRQKLRPRHKSVHQAHRANGKQLRLLACCVITLENGLIKRIEEYVDPAQAAVLREKASA